jgi:hypothetical protein
MDRNKLDKIAESAKDAKYCINCTFAYLNNDTGFGYCKYQAVKALFALCEPKVISEFDTCQHWYPKAKIPDSDYDI